MSKYEQLLIYLELKEIDKNEFIDNLKDTYISEKQKRFVKDYFLNEKSIAELCNIFGLTRGSLLGIKQKVKTLLKREENIDILKGIRKINEDVTKDAALTTLFPRDTPINSRIINALYRCKITTIGELTDILEGSSIVKSSYDMTVYTSVGRVKGLGVGTILHIINTLVEHCIIQKEDLVTIKINGSIVILKET